MSEPRSPALQRVRTSPLIWPVGSVLTLIVINLLAHSDFLSVQLVHGHLYGNVIDIARNSAPVLLVALGMTLVIATRGIDLSVGAIAAIAGAVACVFIADAPAQSAVGTARTRRSPGAGATSPCGCGSVGRKRSSAAGRFTRRGTAAPPPWPAVGRRRPRSRSRRTT